MWRFDKEWRNLRLLVPWVKRAPSDYIREHVRLTIQPLDAPPTPRAAAARSIEQLGSDEMLLYASDYPHQHAADPEALPAPPAGGGWPRKIRYRERAALLVPALDSSREEGGDGRDPA